jgi:hypothetical protein
MIRLILVVLTVLAFNTPSEARRSGTNVSFWNTQQQIPFSPSMAGLSTNLSSPWGRGGSIPTGQRQRRSCWWPCLSRGAGHRPVSRDG